MAVMSRLCHLVGPTAARACTLLNTLEDERAEVGEVQHSKCSQFLSQAWLAWFESCEIDVLLFAPQQVRRFIPLLAKVPWRLEVRPILCRNVFFVDLVEDDCERGPNLFGKLLIELDLVPFRPSLPE